MPLAAAALLALRHKVSAETLLDWADLAQLLEPPCKANTADLQAHWSCCQPTVSRRLLRLWEADLIEYRTSRGGYRIRRLGPVTNCDTGQPAA
jgi:hypothetical protein